MKHDIEEHEPSSCEIVLTESQEKKRKQAARKRLDILRQIHGQKLAEKDPQPDSAAQAKHRGLSLAWFDRLCEVCGTEYNPKMEEWKAKGAGRLTCSKECYEKARAMHKDMGNTAGNDRRKIRRKEKLKAAGKLPRNGPEAHNRHLQNIRRQLVEAFGWAWFTASEACPAIGRPSGRGIDYIRKLLWELKELGQAEFKRISLGRMNWRMKR